MRGFTFIEVIIVVAILLILAGVSMPLYTKIVSSSQLDDAKSDISNYVRIARARSEARLSNSAHGIFFDTTAIPNTFTIFEGADYASRNTAKDLVQTFDGALDVSTSFTGDEINFSKGLAIPDEVGDITITHATEGQRTVSLNSRGLLNEDD